MRFRKQYKKPVTIIVILVLFYALLKAIISTNGVVYFDEGVYVVMAKWVASFGTAGYFEYIRPLALPVLLAPFQLLPLNPLGTGRVLSLLFILACIPLVYFVGKWAYTKEAGLWAAMLFALSGSILFYGGFILTSVLAYTLSLFAIGLTIKHKPFFAGLILGVAFLFKFPAAIIGLPILLFLLFERQSWRKRITVAMYFLIGCGLAAAPYFLFNLFFYDGTFFYRLFHPLLDASNLIKNETWLYPAPNALRYLLQLLITDPLLFISGVTGTVLLFHFSNKKERATTTLLIGSALVFLFYFSFRLGRYDARYALSLVPFLAVLGGAGISILLKRVKRRRTIVRSTVIVVALLIALVTTSVLLTHGAGPHEPRMVDVIANHEGNIIANSGVPLLYATRLSDLQAGPSLAYTYLTYRRNESFDWLIIDPIEYRCPTDNEVCEERLTAHLGRIISRNNIANCGWLHGSRVVILTKVEAEMTREECLTALRSNFPSPDAHTFIRLRGVAIAPDGSLENEAFLKTLIDALDGQEVILLFRARTTLPNEETIAYLRDLPENIRFGVQPGESSAEAFITLFEQATNQQVEVFTPIDDEWYNRPVELPSAVKEVVTGYWEIALTPVPHRHIDLYVYDWPSKHFKEGDELVQEYKMLLDGDIEIGIDIPLYALTNESYEKVTLLINTLGGEE